MLPNVGMFEMMMLLGLAVLLFGKRLPEVGRSLGKGIVEFKKGLSGAVDELDITGTGRSSWNSGSSARTTSTAHAESTLHRSLGTQIRVARHTLDSRRAARDGVSGPPTRLRLVAQSRPPSPRAVPTSRGLRAAGQPHGLPGMCSLESGVFSLGLDQQRGHDTRPPPVVECNVQAVANADLALAGSDNGLGKDLDPCLDRAPADVGDLRRDLDALAHIDWPEEHHGVDRGRRDLSLARVPQRGDSHRTRQPASG